MQFFNPSQRRWAAPARGRPGGLRVRRSLATLLGVAVLGLTTGLAFQARPVLARHGEEHGRHVLLISVDGLHASDLSKWVAAHPHSSLATLTEAGTTYTNASTSEPSDSFPGLLALVTGGTPKSTGVFYDDSYDRTLFAPGSDCQGSGNGPGTETNYAENLDVLDSYGNIPRFPIAPYIDPKNLPLRKDGASCVPVYPHEFLLTNTIFNVAADADLYTAWSDKHPAYEIVRGPQNTGADDLFTPEINSTDPPDPTTVSVLATEQYDQLKVNAVLNEIDGQTSNQGVRTSNGAPAKAVPAIFGMNFQSVSVAEKLVDSYTTPGGYEPGSLDFTCQMDSSQSPKCDGADPGALNFVDKSIGAMANELKQRGLWDTTELIITAKHGQSPIDPSKLHKIGHAVTKVLANAGIIIPAGTGTASGQITDDDIALVWLPDQSQTAAALKALNDSITHGNPARIDYILSGDALADQFGDPRHNTRTPDLIVQPIPGTIYTGSGAKVAEHGGFAPDDTHVALLVVNGNDDSDGQRVVSEQVHTTQVAPTLLAFLGLDSQKLQSVRREGTPLLPR